MRTRRQRALRLQRNLTENSSAPKPRQFVTAAPVRPVRRFAVVKPCHRREVAEACRRLAAREGISAGVYVLVASRGVSKRRELVRAVLGGRAKVLYLGLSQTSLARRTAQLSRGLSGGALQHDAAKEIMSLPPGELDPSSLSLVLVPFQAAYPLESFLLTEHVRSTGELPRFNHGPSTRPSSPFRPPWIRLCWERLIGHGAQRASCSRASPQPDSQNDLSPGPTGLGPLAL